MSSENIFTAIIITPFVILFVWGWTPFLISIAIILAVSVLFFIGYSIYDIKIGVPKQRKLFSEIKENCKKQEQEVIEKHLRQIRDLDNKYGECTKSIEFDIRSQFYSGGGTFYNCFRVYDGKSVIVFDWGKNVIKFSDILKVSIHDSIISNYSPISVTTTTSSKDVFGRAVAGYVLGGGIGAILGGATAPQETTFTYMDDQQHDYTILINTKDLSKPLVTIHMGDDLRATQEIVALIFSIIEKQRIHEFMKSQAKLAD